MQNNNLKNAGKPAAGILPTLDVAKVIEQIPGIVWTVDPELRFTSWVGTATRSFASTESDLLGVTLPTFLGTKNPMAEPIAAHYAALSGKEVTYRMEIEGRHFDCRVRPLEMAGHVVGVVGVASAAAAQDQTSEAIHRASQLEKSNEELRALLKRLRSAMVRTQEVKSF